MGKKLWGTRFAKETNALADRFTSSIAFDKRLAKYDILGSIAHAKMLGRQKIIPAKDALKIVSGLKHILRQVEKGVFKFDSLHEDVHSNIQEALEKRIGSVAQKLHTARSRNDQIVLDVKMYIKDEIDEIIGLVSRLQKSVLCFARKNFKVIIPGYTHLQLAQCVLLAHHMLAYIESLQRDKQRLSETKTRADIMPLGSCAFSGTGLPIHRESVRKELRFKELTDNSIDSVSDRDFIVELLSDIAILAVHSSRIAEDLILWSTKEFDFIDIDFSFCTGSSIMPHKKNPDVLELIRGSVGRIHGDFSSVLILMKGLPLSYNRDLQLDKPPLFDAIDAIKDILAVFVELFKQIKVKEDSIVSKLMDESLFSVDIVEHLIEKGLPYRQAHDVVGRMVKDCLDQGRKISDLTDEELKKYSDKLDTGIRRILNAWASVDRKKSHGGTSPKLVQRQLALWSRRLWGRSPRGHPGCL